MLGYLSLTVWPVHQFEPHAWPSPGPEAVDIRQTERQRLAVEFTWSAEKEERLKAARGVSFEEVQTAIEEGGLIDVIPNPYPEQPTGLIYVVLMRDYTWVVPFHQDDEERRIMEALDAASIESVPSVEDEKRKALAAAKNTLRKTERINLRLTKRDLVGIKAAAREEEIPYQTLIAHLVRKYLEERIKARLGERAS